MPSGDVADEGYLYAHTKPAEIQAVEARGEHCRGAAAYLHTEPGDCLGDHTAFSALVQAGIKRVVVGIRHPLQHLRGNSIRALRGQGLHVEVLGEDIQSKIVEELVCKILESSDLNFSHYSYSDIFFEVVFTGGCTQPGTTKPDEGEHHPYSTIDCEPKCEVILPPVIDIQKILCLKPFLKKDLKMLCKDSCSHWSFEENERKKLAIFTALAFSHKLQGCHQRSCSSPSSRIILLPRG
ncbi:hypothetical protein SLE2022_058450 [Rubroshorea leprosula]|uniref:CMP/dCMP-type deaminase domain-containing protein n=1 Tax=Rubroshorea leprosula TaxID=152421 RepID=A0AAV5LRU7_9ROSI|nr:hypothetical protein SLEP1_g47843 [Rubroshorea leprosula]